MKLDPNRESKAVQSATAADLARWGVLSIGVGFADSDPELRLAQHRNGYVGRSA